MAQCIYAKKIDTIAIPKSQAHRGGAGEENVLTAFSRQQREIQHTIERAQQAGDGNDGGLLRPRRQQYSVVIEQDIRHTSHAHARGK